MPRSLLAATCLLSVAAWGGGAAAQPVTGLYIGGEGGGNFLQREQVRLQAGLPGVGPLYGKSGFEAGWTALGSIGYGLGNGFRIEVEGNYRRNEFGRVPGVFLARPTEEKYGGMLNGLFDLDVGSPYVFPYIGGGVGYERVRRTGVEGIGISGAPFSSPLSATDGSFAWQAIAGLSLPVPPVVGLSVTAEYRYFNVTSDIKDRGVVAGVPISEKIHGDVNHSLMLGLRYAFNVAPPAPPPAQVTPPPAAEATRTYLVFFDWDRADLTPRARQVVAAAAQATTRVQVTRIEVNGYTDTSGTPQYNQGLSVRRANSVAEELVRDGVPRPAISIQGFGETHLLVQTGPNVREPQNRRVEIILH